MSNLRKNLSYQTAYQLLATCVPLITAPYLSRVLGADGLGIYSYTYSNLRYFSLFALLGVAQYGMREIAQNRREGRKKVSETFWEIYLFQLITSIVVAIIYIVFCSATYKAYKIYAIIQVMELIANAFDISWLFFGLEQFKITVVRNFIIKLGTTIAYFVFVNDSNDLLIYTLISAGSVLVSSLSLWIKLHGFVDIVRVTRSGIIKHIKPNLVLFIPSIAASVYHVMDKTMIGLFSDMYQEGYYYNADKVINIPLTVVNGCCTVLMANISTLFSRKEVAEARIIQKEVINFGICGVSALSFGIAAISDDFVPVFFGAGYEACAGLIKIFAFVMVFKAISNYTRSAFLIPQHQDTIYIWSVISGGVVNLVANIVLIYWVGLGAVGAAIGTLIAEFVVCSSQIIRLSINDKETIVMHQTIAGMIYAVFGIIMFSVVQIFRKMIPLNGLIGLILEILVGAIIFLALSGLFWYRYKDKMPTTIRTFLIRAQIIR